MSRKNLNLLLVMAMLAISINAFADRTINKCKTQDGDFKYQKEPCSEQLQTITSWTAPVETKKAKQSVSLEPGMGGHYYLDSEVNGNALIFVVDTGASMVSLPTAVAQVANIKCQNQVVMQTANGATRACSATINKLKIGPFLVKEVAAVIVPNLSQPLLGMNILQQFNIEQDGSRMRIFER